MVTMLTQYNSGKYQMNCFVWTFSLNSDSKFLNRHCDLPTFWHGNQVRSEKLGDCSMPGLTLKSICYQTSNSHHLSLSYISASLLPFQIWPLIRWRMCLCPSFGSRHLSTSCIICPRFHMTLRVVFRVKDSLDIQVIKSRQTKAMPLLYLRLTSRVFRKATQTPCALEKWF